MGEKTGGGINAAGKEGKEYMTVMSQKSKAFSTDKESYMIIHG